MPIDMGSLSVQQTRQLVLTAEVENVIDRTFQVNYHPSGPIRR